MAWTYTQDFEGLTTGDINGQDSWTQSSGLIEVSTAAAQTGTKSLKMNRSGGSSFYERTITSTTSGDLFFAMYHDTSGNKAEFTLRNSSGGAVGSFSFDNGSIKMRDETPTPAFNTVGSYTTNTWHLVHIEYDTAAGEYRSRWTTGATWGAFTAMQQLKNTSAITSIGIGSNSDSLPAYMDEISDTDPLAAGATVPSAFVAGNWTLTDLGTDGDLRIGITTLPSDGGSAITDLEYQQDSGSWTSLSATTTGNYDIASLTNGTSYDFKIRAVNAEGNGADSDTKSATPTAVPDAFVVGEWSMADTQAGGEVEVTITTLPSANGTAITDLEYKVDSGSWTSFSSATTGTYSITGLTNNTSYDFMVRAVNATGNGADSDTKSATPTLAAIPTVTTQAVSSIAAATATGNGNVTADGGNTITERGVCWSTSTGPTTADDFATSAGTTGAFTASMTGLSAGTLYYVRAYAINSEGTAYGSEVTFTSLSAPRYARKRYNSSTGLWETID